MVSLKAHFDGHAIIPDEPIELPRGQGLLVHLELVGAEPPADPGGVLDWAIENAADDPTLPPDLSHEHDRYLYGSPKTES